RRPQSFTRRRARQTSALPSSPLLPFWLCPSSTRLLSRPRAGWPDVRSARAVAITRRIDSPPSASLIAVWCCSSMSSPRRWTAWLYLFVQTIPIVVSLQLLSLVVFRAYRTLWRFLALTDVLNMARALTVGGLAAAAVLLVIAPIPGFSRVVLVLDWLLAAALV